MNRRCCFDQNRPNQHERFDTFSISDNQVNRPRVGKLNGPMSYLNRTGTGCKRGKVAREVKLFATSGRRRGFDYSISDDQRVRFTRRSGLSNDRRRERTPLRIIDVSLYRGSEFFLLRELLSKLRNAFSLLRTRASCMIGSFNLRERR